VTVAVTEAEVNGTARRAVTVNDLKAYEALEKGTVPLAEGEFLGLKPTRSRTWLRRLWGNVNVHAEELGIKTLKEMGAKGGSTATSRAGCWRCQNIIKTLNGMFGNEWTHLNPDPNVVVRPDPGWR